MWLKKKFVIFTTKYFCIATDLMDYFFPQEKPGELSDSDFEIPVYQRRRGGSDTFILDSMVIRKFKIVVL